MNTDRISTNTPPRLSGRLKLLGLIGVALAIAIAAGGFLYLFARSTPAAVSLGGGSPSPSVDAGAATDGGAATGDLTGAWTLDASIGSFADFTGSFVGYRVQEELVGVGAAEAVGRTPDVSGTLVVEGTTITSVEIEADLTTLRSDNDMRDSQLGRQGIQTDTYPTASFVLSEPIELDALPAEGETISVTATGELTLHGVTNTIEVPLEAALADGVVTVVGSIDIAFADYEIPTPESIRVLSVADQCVIEFQLKFTNTTA